MQLQLGEELVADAVRVRRHKIRVAQRGLHGGFEESLPVAAPQGADLLLRVSNLPCQGSMAGPSVVVGVKLGDVKEHQLLELEGNLAREHDRPVMGDHRR